MQSLKARLYFLASLWAFACPSGASELPLKLDFHQALELARERSPDYNAAIRFEKNAQLGYKNSWASLLPQANIEAQHYYNQPEILILQVQRKF